MSRSTLMARSGTACRASALVLSLLVAGPVLAETAVPKSAVVKEKLQPVAPKKEIQRLPLKAVTPQTQEQAGTTETETPAPTLAVTLESVRFSPHGDCGLVRIMRINNTGTVPTPATLVLYHEYIGADNRLIEAPYAPEIPVVQPGQSWEGTIAVPVQDLEPTSQMVVRVKDGANVLTEFRSSLTPMAVPSASNLSLGDGQFAPGQFSVVINNSSDTGFATVAAVFRGYANAGDTSSEFIAAESLCIPARGSQTVTITVPANAWQGYNVALKKSNTAIEYLRRDYWR